MSPFPVNTSFNRFDAKSEDAVGTLGEIKPLQLSPKEYMTCGDPDDPPGVARCRHAKMCGMAWKGREGKMEVVAIDKDRHVVRNKEGQPVLVKHHAGGPKDLIVWRKDGSNGTTKTQEMSCIRFLDNHPRWRLNGDLVKIRAVEGDGREIPFKETHEFQGEVDVTENPDKKVNGVKCTVRHVAVTRACAFHPRPAEVFKDRVLEVQIEGQIKKDENQQLWGDIGDSVPAIDLKGTTGSGSTAAKAS